MLDVNRNERTGSASNRLFIRLSYYDPPKICYAYKATFLKGDFKKANSAEFGLDAQILVREC